MAVKFDARTQFSYPTSDNAAKVISQSLPLFFEHKKANIDCSEKCSLRRSANNRAFEPSMLPKSVPTVKLTEEEKAKIQADIEYSEEVDRFINVQQSRERVHVESGLRQGQRALTRESCNDQEDEQKVQKSLEDILHQDNTVSRNQVNNEELELPDGLIDMLRMSAQCREVDCHQQGCVQGRHLFEMTEVMLSEGMALKSRVALGVLSVVYDHAITCYEPDCFVPWCPFFYERRGNLDCLVALLMRELYGRYGYSSFFDFDENEKEYIKMDSCSPDKSPEVGTDISILSLVGRFGLSALAFYVTKPEDIILSKVESWDVTHEVLKLLRHVQHPHVSTMLWASRYDSKVLLCYQMDYFNNYTDIITPRRSVMSPMRMASVLQQLISAGKFLLQHKVLYLNWTVTSLSFSSSMNCVKLNNMKCAVSAGVIGTADQELVEDITMRLPPYIVAPEMLVEDTATVLAVSGVWGLANLAWELTTASHFYYDHRHLHRDDYLDKIRELNGQSLLNNPGPPAVISLIDQLVQVDPANRPSVFEDSNLDLLQHIIEETPG